MVEQPNSLSTEGERVLGEIGLEAAEQQAGREIDLEHEIQG